MSLAAATRYDIARTLGDTRPLIWTRRAGGVDGDPVDLTGMAASLSFYARGTDTEVARLDTSNSGITLGGVAGTVTIDIGHDDYTVLDAGVYAYRLDFVEGGETRPLLRGDWRILK